MRTVYRVLAFAVAGLVVVQAAAIAFAVFGLFAWVQQGGTLDASNMGPESSVSFPGVVGFMIHGMFGTLVIPVVALLLLVSSFFAKTAGAVRWGVIVFVTTAVQVVLGMAAHGLPQLGILHGIIALVLFGAAVMAAMQTRRVVAVTPADSASQAAPVASS